MERTYIPLICQDVSHLYIWTISSEGDHWIDAAGNKVDIDPDKCKIIEVKLSNGQIISNY